MLRSIITISLVSLFSFNLLACTNSDINPQNQETSTIELENSLKDISYENIILNESDFEKIEEHYNMTDTSNKEILSIFKDETLTLSKRSIIESFIPTLNFKNLILNSFDIKIDEFNNILIINFDENTSMSEEEFDIFNEYICILIFSMVDDLNVLELNMGKFKILNGKDFAEILIKENIETKN